MSTGPSHPWEGPRFCAGTTRMGTACCTREIGDLGWCLAHVPDDLLDAAEELRGARRCRTRDGCRQYAVAGTLPACKCHGANIGSVQYRQAAMRVVEQRIGLAFERIIAAQ